MTRKSEDEITFRPLVLHNLAAKQDAVLVQADAFVTLLVSFAVLCTIGFPPCVQGPVKEGPDDEGVGQ